LPIQVLPNLPDFFGDCRRQLVGNQFTVDRLPDFVNGVPVFFDYIADCANITISITGASNLKPGVFDIFVMYFVL
jgi:hypothetical protein